MEWSFVEYQGKLAITLGWESDLEKPVERRTLWFHPTEKWDEWYYNQFTQIRLWQNNIFQCYSSRTGSLSTVDTSCWQSVTEHREIKPPRRGKRYTWRWSYGKWVKDY